MRCGQWTSTSSWISIDFASYHDGLLPSVALHPSVEAFPPPPTPKLVFSSSGQDWRTNLGQQKEEKEEKEGWQEFGP